MFKRVMLPALISILILSVAGCGSDTPQQETPAAAAPAPPPKPEEKVPVYELTKDNITSHPDWTSRNISILGAKIGDKTNEAGKAFGEVDNTRTLQEEYLTLYQHQGLFVYTFKATGRMRKFEVNVNFASKIADPKLKKLLTDGDLKSMREVLGMEEGEAIQNTDDPSSPSTEYSYDSRGFRFVRYKVGDKTVNAIRFTELKKAA